MKEFSYTVSFGIDDYEAGSKIVYGNLPQNKEVNVVSALLSIDEATNTGESSDVGKPLSADKGIKMELSELTFHDERVPFVEDLPPESDFRGREKMKTEKQAQLLASFITQLVDAILLPQTHGTKIVIPFAKGVSNEVYKIVGDFIDNVDEKVVNFGAQKIVLTCL